MSQRVITSVSVPPDVRERMQQTTGENWSAIATRAFVARLAEIEGEQAGKAAKKNVRHD